MSARLKVFLDTNILVYAYDHRVPEKQKTAHSLLKQNLHQGSGLISTQVIQEFCNVTLTKIKNIDGHGVKQITKGVLKTLLAHKPDEEFYMRVVDLFESVSISFYDALIVQAAIDLDCDVIYSEDLQAGQKFGKLTVVNPFQQLQN